MTVVSAFVLWVIIWFLTLFVVLPIGLTTQEEAGEVVPGTPAGAPVLTWISGTGQTYRILSGTNLLADFDPLAVHLSNSAPLNVYSGAPDSRPAVFYHVVEE